MNLIQRQFYALYEPDMPSEVTLGGKTYQWLKTFKHDFFAATGLYRHDDDQVVVKIYRCRRFFGLPMRWVGRLMVRHETRLYKLLERIDGIPDFVGLVGPTGFAHKYVPGGPLRRFSMVDDLFFDRLETILEQIHARRAAYVDLDKAENVLLGEDGKPHLIDFQISYAPRIKLPPIKQIENFILGQLQLEDRYHLGKHKRRIRPDLLTTQQHAATYKRSLPIRLHRVISKPYFALRRFLLALLKLKPAK